MTTHFMKLNSEPFDKIKEGSKIYELRLHDEKRQRIKIGDLIEFTKLDTAEKCKVRVIELCLFNSFSELYSALPLQQCGYALDELEKASPIDMEKYYSKEEQARYGVVAIKIEVC